MQGSFSIILSHFHFWVDLNIYPRLSNFSILWSLLFIMALVIVLNVVWFFLCFSTMYGRTQPPFSTTRQSPTSSVATIVQQLWWTSSRQDVLLSPFCHIEDISAWLHVGMTIAGNPANWGSAIEISSPPLWALQVPVVLTAACACKQFFRQWSVMVGLHRC